MFKVSGNHSCICGSDKKYKKCCKGTLTPAQEEYVGYIQIDSTLKQKIVLILQKIIPRKELNECINLFLDIYNLDSLESEAELQFIDWILNYYSKYENMSVLEYINSIIEDELSTIEKEIIQAWISTQTGIYEVLTINKHSWEIKLKEVQTHKEYIVRDLAMSKNMNVGNWVFSKLIHVRSFTIINSFGTQIQNDKKEAVITAIKKLYHKELEKNPSLSYEYFMNTHYEVIVNRISNNMNSIELNGIKIGICSKVVEISKSNLSNIKDFYNSREDFIINEVKYKDITRDVEKITIEYFPEKDDKRIKQVYEHLSSINKESEHKTTDYESLISTGKCKFKEGLVIFEAVADIQIEFMADVFKEHFKNEIVKEHTIKFKNLVEEDDDLEEEITEEEK